MPNPVLCHEAIASLEPETHTKILEVITADQTGLLKGRLIVGAHLPVDLAQGLFARPGTYDVSVKLATTPVRGMSIRMLGVDAGLALLQSTATQEFVLGAATEFATNSAAANNHPLDEEYYSPLPISFGDTLAKFGVVPSSPVMLVLRNHPFESPNSDALREAAIAFFQYNPAEFEFKVQLHTGLDTTDFRTIARLVIQPPDVDPAIDTIVESMSFSPTPTLPAQFVIR